ncbi:transcription termination/antitermination protein NusG [Senegalia massiliensis]|uniref:transcription termination/antitermination protein NusG n=1 Tax=Senegalia massiliensis TaxID=1720316 RepID=UPI0013EEF8F0|nr:transcription termination/antitermination protein NusG [Senegalia massiliensis]
MSDKAKWYVVHTYSGHENKVKANIEKLVENRSMQDIVHEILVPTEEYVEVKDGKKKVKERKKFPSYVIVKMVMTDESWYLVRNTRGVTGFVGPGSKPIPLTPEEIKNMGVKEALPEIDIKVDDSIKVISGPFENFMGTVKEINTEKRKLKVFISMFGRETLVELDFDQVQSL